jgi:hypothetical protein
MSLSSRNGSTPRRQAAASWLVVRTAVWAPAVTTVGVLVTPADSFAAEVFYQPVVTLSTAYNSNLDLEPTNRRSGEGYFADVATLIGIATPTSQTTLQPRLVYNYYPSQTDRNRLEEFLNLNSTHSWRRDRFSITGFFDHRDDVNAEQPTAEVNPVNPGVGNTTPATGQIQVGTTRNWLVVDPTYSHLITPLSSIGVGAEYQRLTFNPQDTSGHIDFNYYLAKVFYAWTYSQRTDFTVSAFGSRYLAGSIDSNSTSGGVTGEMKYSWTQTLQSNLSTSYERVKFEETSPRDFSQTTNTWAASLSTVYTGPASSYRATIGRSIAPSAAGGLFSTDQVRGQYDRDFSERLHFMGALRYFRDHTVAGARGDDMRDYVTSTVKLQWMMTRRIFVAGAYTFLWQKYRASPSGADANVVSFQIGYKGIERQH